ncbi:hypothetical protein HK097_006011 [Rhizophlyctis rosea]|uniref:Uncharacterized protein n=1 Tax=Rhizophlyctis rosea TaxID=64517 RepID=A0AAD5RZR7_9FUNG|nr:hypothetical protein HK097_006011 [Rhizophlyctis rosea]
MSVTTSERDASPAFTDPNTTPQPAFGVPNLDKPPTPNFYILSQEDHKILLDTLHGISNIVTVNSSKDPRAAIIAHLKHLDDNINFVPMPTEQEMVLQATEWKERFAQKLQNEKTLSRMLQEARKERDSLAKQLDEVDARAAKVAIEGATVFVDTEAAVTVTKKRKIVIDDQEEETTTSDKTTSEKTTTDNAADKTTSDAPKPQPPATFKTLAPVNLDKVHLVGDEFEGIEDYRQMIMYERQFDHTDIPSTIAVDIFNAFETRDTPEILTAFDHWEKATVSARFAVATRYLTAGSEPHIGHAYRYNESKAHLTLFNASPIIHLCLVMQKRISVIGKIPKAPRSLLVKWVKTQTVQTLPILKIEMVYRKFINACRVKDKEAAMKYLDAMNKGLSDVIDEDD